MREIKPKCAYTDPDAVKPMEEPRSTPRRRSPPTYKEKDERRTPSNQTIKVPPRPAPPRIIAKVTVCIPDLKVRREKTLSVNCLVKLFQSFSENWTLSLNPPAVNLLWTEEIFPNQEIVY